MVEVVTAIGVAASVASLVEMAAKVSIGLFEVARAIGGTYQEIRTIARPMKLISDVLSNLQEVMKRKGKISKPTLLGEILLEDALAQCREIVHNCERLEQIF